MNWTGLLEQRQQTEVDNMTKNKEIIFDMAVLSILLVAVLFVTGCVPKKPVIIDPCDKAAKTCYGAQGENPSDNKYCGQLTSCFSWEMRAK